MHDVIHAAHYVRNHKKDIRRMGSELYPKNQTAHIALMMVAIALILFTLTVVWNASAEAGQPNPLYVAVEEGSILNGRAAPSIKSQREQRFERGEAVIPTGGVENGWVEVIGGETGTVWCKAEHLTEYGVEADYKNTSGGRVFIHDELGDDSKDVNHAVENGRSVTITRVLFGFGYMGGGWVDLNYMEPVDGDGT